MQETQDNDFNIMMLLNVIRYIILSATTGYLYMCSQYSHVLSLGTLHGSYIFVIAAPHSMDHGTFVSLSWWVLCG